MTSFPIGYALIGDDCLRAAFLIESPQNGFWKYTGVKAAGYADSSIIPNINEVPNAIASRFGFSRGFFLPYDASSEMMFAAVLQFFAPPIPQSKNVPPIKPNNQPILFQSKLRKRN